MGRRRGALAGRGGIAAVARATGIAETPIGRGCASWTRASGSSRAGCGGRGGGRKPLSASRPDAASRIWSGWSRRTAVAIPESPLRWTCKSVRELAEALARARAIGASHRWSRGCCAGWATACRPTARPARAPAIPTATRSSSTSTTRSRSGARGRRAGDLGRHQEEGAGRRLQERRARVAAQGPARAGAGARLHRSRSWAGRSPTASTTSPPTPAGSASASTTTPPPSRSRASAAGGSDGPAALSRAPRRLLITADCGGSNGSRVAAVEASSCSGLADETGLSDHASATSRPAPASGTGSSIACSRSSPRTGAASRSSATRSIVQLIAATTTRTGLDGPAPARPNAYPKGVKVSDAELAAINLQPPRLPRRMELHHQAARYSLTIP